MQNRLLGSAKTPVSAIGLGCMGMSEFYGATHDVQAHRTIARALELSVNFFDSADIDGFGLAAVQAPACGSYPRHAAYPLSGAKRWGG